MLILIAGTNGNIHSLGKYPDKLHRVEYETMRRGLGGSPGNKEIVKPHCIRNAQTQGAESYEKRADAWATL